MKVKYLPWQPHCFAFGGLEIQMLSTLNAVQNVGVDAAKMDVWSRDNDFDILHVWGLDHIHEIAVYFASKAGKKIVITSLFQNFDPLVKRLRHFVSSYTGIAKCMTGIAAMADSIVVVNDIEADIAHKYFKIPYSKITYIPNIVDSKYFDKPTGTIKSFRGMHGYVLATGSICVRKNQLNLAKACKKLNLKLILVGNTLLGEEVYGAEVTAVIDEMSGSMIIEGLPPHSEELISAYRNCAVFALPSQFEQGPISAYEALATGCKLLIANKKYSYQEFYQNVKRVDPNSIDSIAAGLKDIINNPEKYEQPLHVMDACKSENVGMQYKALYETLGQ